jgi:hypothetical protein
VGTDLYVAGWFYARGSGSNNISRWDGTRWYDMDGGTNDMVMSVFPVGGDVYIAGNFTQAGGRAASRVAAWDGTDWRPLGSGVDLEIWTFAVAARDNGEVFVGGDHDTAGGIPSPRIARWYNPVPYPANPYPPHGSNNQLADVALSWGTSGSTGSPDTYNLFLGTTPNPPLVATGLTTAGFTPDPLYNDTQYYWKVVSRTGADRATGSVWTFRTEDLVTSKLLVSSATNRCGQLPDTVTIDIGIEDCDVPIDAAGVDIQYDPSVLKFVACEPGELTQDWVHFEGADLGSAVRIGGYHTTPIPRASFGVFARLLFVADCCGPDSTVSYDLTPVNPTDDLAGLRGVPGNFTCEFFVPDGDINGDGYLTSGDAYCTFDTYLSFPEPLPNDCGASGWDIRSDVDCSGDITPGDALCIYYNWLDGSCEFCEGAGPEAAAGSGPASVSVREVIYNQNSIDVVVSVANAPALDAFGLEIEYTDGTLQFAGVIRSETVLNFEQFGAIQTQPDRLRVGAFDSGPVDATAETDLFIVRFIVADPTATGSIDIVEFVDDLEGAAPVHDDVIGTGETNPDYNRFTLHPNCPNPFNPDTEISYEVPGYAGFTPVLIVIYDVKGRLVKTVENSWRSAGLYSIRWDGRNESGQSVASGVYFYVLRAGQVTLSRKLVLLK